MDIFPLRLREFLAFGKEFQSWEKSPKHLDGYGSPAIRADPNHRARSEWELRNSHVLHSFRAFAG